jgi:hypothetical protein
VTWHAIRFIFSDKHKDAEMFSIGCIRYCANRQEFFRLTPSQGRFPAGASKHDFELGLLAARGRQSPR